MLYISVYTEWNKITYQEISQSKKFSEPMQNTILSNSSNYFFVYLFGFFIQLGTCSLIWLVGCTYVLLNTPLELFVPLTQTYCINGLLFVIDSSAFDWGIHSRKTSKMSRLVLSRDHATMSSASENWPTIHENNFANSSNKVNKVWVNCFW